MSIIPGEKLLYAETHFKFKLPWSLLYRPWPEILVDAPFQFVPGVSPSLWIVVRDAHRFPTEITALEVQVEKADSGHPLLQKNFSLDISAKEQFEFHPVELGELAPGKYRIHCTVHASRNGKSKVFSRWNFPGLKPAPLMIQVLGEPLPKPAGFVAGEMHCHTHYSADHVEHGAAPAVFQQAAEAIGLDFVSCTDHAYDFAFLTEDYTREAESPLPRFEALKKDVALLNNNPQGKNSVEHRTTRPLMIAGEEVSAGNSKGENVHMTVMGPAGYLPGLGDCGRNWLDNKPTFKILQILSMTEAPCFAAHPHQQMGLLEKFIFRRGYWSSKDLQAGSRHPVRGIQFWNGLRDEGFKLGKNWWIEELGKENYLLPIGGNDAHGDLNDTTAVNLPLFSLKHSRHHVFGKVRTVIQLKKPLDRTAEKNRNAEETEHTEFSLEAPLTCESVQQAFAGDNCYITDGPALWWERTSLKNANVSLASTADGSRDIDTRDAAVTFRARSNRDLGGGFRYIRIYGRRRSTNGKLLPQEELHLASQVATRDAVDIKVYFDDFAYLRAECETATGRYALTSAAVNQRSHAKSDPKKFDSRPR